MSSRIERIELDEQWAHSAVVVAGEFAFISYCMKNEGQNIDNQINGAFDVLENRLKSIGLTLESVVKMDCLTVGKPVHVTALKIFAKDGIRLSRVKINIAVPVKIHLREHIFLFIVGRKHLALTHTADCTARKDNKNFHILTSFIFCP